MDKYIFPVLEPRDLMDPYQIFSFFSSVNDIIEIVRAQFLWVDASTSWNLIDFPSPA